MSYPSTYEERAMANHLTPTELAEEANLDRHEVIRTCMQLGVPIIQGRIDKSLFMASLREAQMEPVEDQLLAAQH